MNNPSLDSLLLTLLATQTPEAIRTEGDRTVLTFSAHGAKVEVSRSFSFGRGGWFSLEPLSQVDEVREFVWARIQPGWDLCTNSKEVAEAFDECCRRTEPIKQAKIIAALKSITATP